MPLHATLTVLDELPEDVAAMSQDLWDEMFRPEEISRGYCYAAIEVDIDNSQDCWVLRADLYPSLPFGTVVIGSRVGDWTDGTVVTVQSTRPVELTNVILSTDPTHYDSIVENKMGLVEWIRRSGRIIRTSTKLQLDVEGGNTALDVRLCEPVVQGVIGAATEIVIARGSSSHEVGEEDVNELVGEMDKSQFFGLEGSHASLSSSLHFSAPTRSKGSLPSLQAHVLTRPVRKERLQGQHISEDEDKEMWVLLNSEAMCSLGLFSVDLAWVSHGADAPKRLVRVFAGGESDDGVHLSPVLWHNMGSPAQLVITPLSSPEKRKQTLLKVADAINIYKIPTPTSTDRELQPAVLGALRSHFFNMKRVMRSGDIFGVGIDEETARAVYVPPSPDADEDDGEDLDLLSGRKTAAVWFMVEIEGEMKDAEVIIDPETTRMTQVGSKQLTIPKLSNGWPAYLELSTTLPPPPPSSTPATNLPPAYPRLKALLTAALSPRARKLPPSTILLHGARAVGKSTLAHWAAGEIGIHVFEINAYEIVGETSAKTEAYLRARIERAGGYAPCLVLLRHVEALGRKKADNENGESFGREIIAEALEETRKLAGEFGVALVGTTSEKEKVGEGVVAAFRHEIEVGAPSEGERLCILETLVKRGGIRISPDVELRSLATKSAALVAGDLVDVVRRAEMVADARIENFISGSGQGISAKDVHVAGRWVNAADFDAAMNEARKAYSDSIGAPKIPNVTWDDVGGLASVKDDIMDTIQLPLDHPELFASGMKKRSGILFYGPPGTGKTLLAKAVATSFSLNFFSVKGPELLNMYIGESEANVRRVFQRAREARPCVVFFDELDSVAPKRGNQGDSGGVMDRIVSQLLAELDGMSGGGSGDVFVIGATNRPDLLDPALLRPGRFDKMVYLGVSNTHEQQLNILQALTRKFRLSPSLDLANIANACSFTYTGADFYALCSDAMLKAMTRQAAAVDRKVKSHVPPISTHYFFDHLATEEDTEVVVTEEDFMKAMDELVPSVSEKELAHFKEIQSKFSMKKEEKKDNGKGNAVEDNAAQNGNGVEPYTWIGKEMVQVDEGMNGMDEGEGRGSAGKNVDRKGKGKARAF
ncbi:peroxisomal assembly protein [Saitoella coloradoensis]